jgi:hypothetical protein
VPPDGDLGVLRRPEMGDEKPEWPELSTVSGLRNTPVAPVARALPALKQAAATVEAVVDQRRGHAKPLVALLLNLGRRGKTDCG